jgi:hypothetical protein
MVSFTPQPLYPWGNCPRYRLDRRLGGPQSWSGCCGEEKNLAPAGKQTLAIQLVARPYTDRGIPTPSCHLQVVLLNYEVFVAVIIKIMVFSVVTLFLWAMLRTFQKNILTLSEL